MKLRKAPPKKARIEIIPMIDAIFFLLVFFMFSSLSMVRLSGSSVALPAKSAASKANVPVRGTDKSVILTVAGDGRLFVGKEPVAQGTLPRALETRLGGNPDAVVVVNMDKKQKAQKLITIIDAINAVALPGGKRPTVLVATEPLTPR